MMQEGATHANRNCVFHPKWKERGEGGLELWKYPGAGVECICSAGS